MPTTTVTITNTTSAAGTVTVRQGELSGRNGRTVILQATPSTGYVFDKWEIETTPVQLQEFARVGTRYNSVDEVCSAEQVDLTTPLYTDGTQLYTDGEGKYAAAEGVYQSNRGTYYNYRGSAIPPLEVCQAQTTTQTQSGASGGGGGFVRNVTQEQTQVTDTERFNMDRTRVNLDFGPNVQ